MALGRVNHMHFGVDDLKKTAEYFVKKLGFKLVRRVQLPESRGEFIELASPCGDLCFHKHKSKQ